MLATAQCFDLMSGAAIAWSARGWLVDPRFALGLWVGAGLNLVGLVAFLFRRLRWGRPALAAVQVGNVLFSLAASVLVSPVWFLLGTVPASITLILILALRKTEAPRPPGASEIQSCNEIKALRSNTSSRLRS